jgi:hypothetical protein
MASLGRSEASAAAVRRLLMGLEGPYADPRVALDPLDNLSVLVAELDTIGRSLLAESLLALVLDVDPVVASGAAIGCGAVAHHLDPVTLERTLFLADDRLDRSPVGFASARTETIRGELAFAAAQSSCSSQTLLERVVAASGQQRSMLVAEIAARWPALVLWRAHDWVGPDDTGVLARLPAHSQRIAVAGAARPWSVDAVDRVVDIGRWRQWDPLDVEALQRVMRDAAPGLTRPDDLHHELDRDGRRWWIVAEEPWAWTLWRSADGAYAMEELQPGWSMLGRSRMIDEATAVAWMVAVLSENGPESAQPHG